MRFLAQLLFFASVVSISLPTFAADVCLMVKDASVVAQDSENTSLGKIVNSYNTNSIFNEYGDFGSQYSTKSIWNQYGSFGGEYGTYSPFNKYAASPPMLIKSGKLIGYLTVNKSVQPSISPNLLKELCKDEL